MLIGIYLLIVEVGGPEAWKGYNYWAVLVLDILSLVFWLVSFALMAARVAPFADGFEICGVLYCDTEPLEGIYLTLFACLAAIAGLGGIDLYAVSPTPLLRGGQVHDDVGPVQRANLGPRLKTNSLLFIVSLAIHSAATHRHRAAGLHSSPDVGGLDGGVPPDINGHAVPPEKQEQQQPQHHAQHREGS